MQQIIQKHQNSRHKNERTMQRWQLACQLPLCTVDSINYTNTARMLTNQLKNMQPPLQIVSTTDTTTLHKINYPVTDYDVEVDSHLKPDRVLCLQCPTHSHLHTPIMSGKLRTTSFIFMHSSQNFFSSQERPNLWYKNQYTNKSFQDAIFNKQL